MLCPRGTKNKTVCPPRFQGGGKRKISAENLFSADLCYYGAERAYGIKNGEYLMRIFDISQEVFGCAVYPGDPMPKKTVLNSMQNGDTINLTAFSMCAHNGTHIDAPFHFINGGKTVDRIPLEVFVGTAYVAEHSGTVTESDALEMLEKAKKQDPEAAKRILIKGDAEVSLEAAKVFAASDILLFGNESQTVGPKNAPMAVHLVLLGAGVILLEGIRLSEVPEGVYFMNAAPLDLSGADGSPCRAILIDPMG